MVLKLSAPQCEDSGWCTRIEMKSFILHITTHLHVFSLELRTVKDAVCNKHSYFLPRKFWNTAIAFSKKSEVDWTG